MPYLFLVLLAYLLGSLPTAALIARGRGIDIRRAGSGNSGATNAYRLLGPLPALAVLAVDAAKAVLAIFLAGWLAARAGLDSGMARALAAGAAVLGHVFSPWLGFSGGKGVATGAAAAFALAPLAAAPCLLVFALVLALGRFVSLASLAAALFLPPAYLLLYPPKTRSPAILVFFCLASGLVILAHRRNLRRLLRGEEPRFRFRRSPPESDASLPPAP